MNEGLNLAEDLKRISVSNNVNKSTSISNQSIKDKNVNISSSPAISTIQNTAYQNNINNNNNLQNVAQSKDVKFSNAVSKFMKTDIVNEVQNKKELALASKKESLNNPFDTPDETNDVIINADSIKAINNEKQILIAKRLQDRELHIQNEAKMLNALKKELSDLRIDLSKEIGILQNEIDTKTREINVLEIDYKDIQQRYLTLQKTLEKKKERKTQLTNHLSTIISHHETRKANKLNELLSMTGETIEDKNQSTFKGFS